MEDSAWHMGPGEFNASPVNLRRKSIYHATRQVAFQAGQRRPF
jgi:hypothetical protein